MPHRHEFGGYRQAFIGLILFLVVAGTALPASAQDPIHWSVVRTNNDILRSGELFEVELTAQMDPTWHLYALTQPLGGPEPLVITIPPGRTFSLAGEVSSWLPKSSHDPNFNIETQFFEERAVFTLPVETALFTKDGVHRLAITVGYQTCNDRLCLPPREEELDTRCGDWKSGSWLGGHVPSANSRGIGVQVSCARCSRPRYGGSIGWLEHLARLCVSCGGDGSPVAAHALCVSDGADHRLLFHKTRRPEQARRSRSGAFLRTGHHPYFHRRGVHYCGGVWRLGPQPLRCRSMAQPRDHGIVRRFRLEFVRHLRDGSALPAGDVCGESRFGARPLSRDDAHGAGVYADVIYLHGSIPRRGVRGCVPGELAMAARWHAGFLYCFRDPFVVLALAPQLLSALPRSGMWLIAVKATMGMLELAAGMKFLSNADLVWGWGIFTRPVVIGSWIVVAAILAAYFAGFIPLGQAHRLGRPGSARLLASVTCVILALWLATGLSGKRLGELESFLPPADIHGAADGELAWLLNDYETALAEAKQQDRPILVDFTGYTCTNCRWMEANMFPRPDVTRELARYVRVRLYTDGRGEIYRRFQQMEQEWFGTVALPYYAVLTPAGEPVVSFGGLTRDSTEYLRFLRKGLE